MLGSVALLPNEPGDGGGPSASVANESEAQRRVRLLSDAVRGLPVMDQQEAVRRLATRVSADGRRSCCARWWRGRAQESRCRCWQESSRRSTSST